MDEGRQSLSRELPISSAKINPYRIVTDYDFRALGKFIAYTFCRRAGRLPKVPSEDAYDELSNKVLLRHLKAAKEIEAYDIAAYLIDHGQYPVESILCRPFMWAVFLRNRRSNT